MTVLDNAIFMVVKFDIFSSREQTMSRRRHGTKTLVLRPELANKTGISKIRSLRGCQCASHHWGSIYLDCRDHILLDALRPILILGVVSVKGGTWHGLAGDGILKWLPKYHATWGHPPNCQHHKRSECRLFGRNVMGVDTEKLSKVHDSTTCRLEARFDIWMHNTL